MTDPPDVAVCRFGDLEAIAAHASVIDALNAASARPSPFATFAHLRNAIQHGPFAASRNGGLWFLGAFDGAAMIGYVALKLTHERVMRLPARRIGFLVGHECDRPGVVASREQHARVVRAIYRYLDDHRREWDYVEFEQQEARSSLHPPPAGIRLRGCVIRGFPSWDNCTIGIRWRTSRDYLAALDGKFATNVKRQMRKLYSLGVLEAMASSDPQSTPAMLELFCDIERRSWKTGFETAVGADPARLAYYRGLLGPEQPMKITIVLLLLDGNPIAGFLGGEFALGSEIGAYGLQIVYDGRYQAAAPGSAVLAIAMHRAIERGCAFLNLLAGFTYYKSQWLAEATPMHTAQIYRRMRLPHLRRLLGDLKRSLTSGARLAQERFNPSRRRAEANPDRSAAAQQPAARARHRPSTANLAADVEATLARARRGRCERLTAEDLGGLWPFLKSAGTKPCSR